MTWIMQTHGVRQCTEMCGADTMQGEAWLQSGHARLGRTGLSDGLTWMLVKAEDGGDFSDNDI